MQIIFFSKSILEKRDFKAEKSPHGPSPWPPSPLVDWHGQFGNPPPPYWSTWFMNDPLVYLIIDPVKINQAYFWEAFFSILPMHKGWSLWNHWICIDPSPMGSTRQSKWAGWPSEMLTSLILLMKLGGLPSPSSAIISCSALLNLFSSKFLMESVPVLKLLGNWGSVTMFCLLLTWTLQLT